MSMWTPMEPNLGREDDGIPAADPGAGGPPPADGFGISGEEPDRPEEATPQAADAAGRTAIRRSALPTRQRSRAGVADRPDRTRPGGPHRCASAGPPPCGSALDGSQRAVDQVVVAYRPEDDAGQRQAADRHRR